MNCLLIPYLFIILFTYIRCQDIDMDLEITRPKRVPTLGIMPSPDQHLHIYALPVGDGDATIVQCPGGELIVIDMGTKNAGYGWNEYQVKTWLGSNVGLVSTIVVTKGSSDHYNYIPKVFQSDTTINRIILGGRKEDYQSSNFITWVNQRTHVLQYVNNQQPCITQCNVKTAPPMCRGYNNTVKFRFLGANLGSDSDGRSLLLQISVAKRGFKFFMPGDFQGTDIESLVMNEWQWEGDPIQSTHYKISNRGIGQAANSFEFLQAIQPVYAFTSNQYPSSSSGPDCTTINRLLSIGTIGKRSKSGSYACFNNNAKAIMQYTSWVYDVYTTAPYPKQIEIIQIDVPIYS